MVRVSLEFFTITLANYERTWIVFQRFDAMCSHLEVSIQCRTWMLLSLMGLAPRTWTDVLKEMGQRMPTDEGEHRRTQRHLLRERILGNHVFEFKMGVSSHTHTLACTLLDTAEPQPLHLCLGNPTTKSTVTIATAVAPASNTRFFSSRRGQ